MKTKMIQLTQRTLPLLLMLALLFSAGCIEHKDPFDNEDEEEQKEEEEKKNGKLTSFVFEKKYNPQLKEDVEMTIHGNGKISGYLSYDADLSSLTPTFTMDKGTLYLNSKEQTSGKGECDFSSPVEYVFKGDAGKETSHIVTLLPYTGLPVVKINTKGEAEIKNKTDWITATLTIDGMGKFDDYESNISVRGRGNSTWGYPKKPFNIKLENKEPVLGMPKQKRWVFLANYRDRTFLRNKVSFHIGEQMSNLAWTPHSEFAEVILNGEHIGLYQITEHVRVDKNRVNIDEMTAEDTDGSSLTGGYLLELDKRLSDVNHFVTEEYEVPVNIKNPDEDVLVPAQKAYLENYFEQLETALRKAGAASQNKDPKASEYYQEVYEKYLDIDSFIDYWIVEALAGNTEMKTPYSVFLYKKRDGKIFAGPLWDFDYTTYATETNVFPVNRQDNLHFYAWWYSDLFRDTYFVGKAKERLAQVRPMLEKIPEYIQQQSELIAPSVELNWEKWGISMKVIGTSANGDETIEDYQDAIDRMVTIYNARIDLLENELNKKKS